MSNLVCPIEAAMMQMSIVQKLIVEAACVSLEHADQGDNG